MAINIEDLSAEQKAELKQQLEAEEKSAKEKKLRERKVYEQIRDAQVKTTFKKLGNISSELEKSKNIVFDDFKAILDMKRELFEMTEEKMLSQESHTFTTSDGNISIIVGHNVVDGWDETVSIGVEKVNQWLKDLARDEESAMLVGIIRDLMKPNKDGALKANRILDLKNKAKEVGNKQLLEAVELIESAYRPTKTSTYVKAKYKDDRGQWQWLALSMSAA